MPLCCAPGCEYRTEYSLPGIAFFNFPFDSERAREWMESLAKATGKVALIQKTEAVLCSQHFSRDEYIRVTDKKFILKAGAIPRDFSPKAIDLSSRLEHKDAIRLLRKQNRKQKPNRFCKDPALNAILGQMGVTSAVSVVIAKKPNHAKYKKDNDIMRASECSSTNASNDNAHTKVQPSVAVVVIKPPDNDDDEEKSHLKEEEESKRLADRIENFEGRIVAYHQKMASLRRTLYRLRYRHARLRGTVNGIGNYLIRHGISLGQVFDDIIQEPGDHDEMEEDNEAQKDSAMEYDESMENEHAVEETVIEGSELAGNNNDSREEITIEIRDAS